LPNLKRLKSNRRYGKR